MGQRVAEKYRSALVTGGAGFIGSHLVHRLLKDGCRVRVVDNLSTGNLDRIADVATGVDFVRADLATDALEGVLDGIDVVFHLAALPSVPRSVSNPLATHESVATATLRVLLAARDAGARRVVVSSSSSVYGDAPGLPRREEQSTRPVSPYAAAKLLSETYARQFCELYGLGTVALRYFNVFGEGQDPSSSYAAAIPKFIECAISGLPLTVFGDGNQTRDFTYVANVVEANIAAATAERSTGRVFNIASGQPRTLLQLISTLEGIAGVELRVEHAPERPGDVRDSSADISAAFAEMGWRPTVTFEDGLRRTVDWCRSR